jgi:hypothetical protein
MELLFTGQIHDNDFNPDRYGRFFRPQILSAIKIMLVYRTRPLKAFGAEHEVDCFENSGLPSIVVPNKDNMAREE